MKFAFCSDAHGRFAEFVKIEADYVFFLGDMLHNTEYIDEFGKDLLQFYYKNIDKEELVRRFLTKNQNIKENLQIPPEFQRRNIFIIPGNHDTVEFFAEMAKFKNLQNIHLKKIQLDSVIFAAHGGMIVPDKKMEFERHFSFSSKTIANNLLKMNIPENSVLLMHELPLTEYAEEIREVIENIKPRIVIGCHNHEGPEETNINGIKYVNCGALCYGKYKIFEFS